MKKVTVTREYIDSLKKSRDEYKRELEICRKDRQKFREFYISMFKEQTVALGQGKHLAPSYLIERLARLLNQVESWYW